MPTLLFPSRASSYLASGTLLMVALVGMASTPEALAFSSNNYNQDPSSNGTFFPTEGTFQTTIRGVNLSGVATFSTGASATSDTTSGRFSVSYEGLTYAGNVDGSIDPAGGTVAAVLTASVDRQGVGTLTEISEAISSSFEKTGTEEIPGGDAIINLPDEVTVVVVDDGIDPPRTTTTTHSGLTQTITLPSSVADTFGWVDETTTTTTESSYRDTAYVSGSFNAKLKNSFPNQIFTGKGAMEFTMIDFELSPPKLVSTNVNISVKGVRISDSDQSFTSAISVAPSIITTISNTKEINIRGKNTPAGL